MLEKQVGGSASAQVFESGTRRDAASPCDAHTKETHRPRCVNSQTQVDGSASCEQSREQSCEQAAPRARVVGVPCSRTGLCKDSSRSRTTGAGARVREGRPPIRDKEAYFKAWRIAIFGSDIDPVRAAVDEAVRTFSTHQPERDRRVWLSVADAIGYEKFLDLFWEQKSIVDDCKRRGKPLRLPAAAFQKRLNRYTDHNMAEGGAK